MPKSVLRSICFWERISCDCCKVFSQDPPAHSLFLLECLPRYGLGLYYILLFVNNSFFNISTMGVPDVNTLATFILFYLQRYFVFGLNAGCEGVSDSPCCWKLSPVCSAPLHPPGPARPPTAPSASEPGTPGGRLSLSLLKRAEWI